MSRDQINAWRAEDGLGPYVDETLAKLFADFAPIFTDDELPQFTESRPVSQKDED